MNVKQIVVPMDWLKTAITERLEVEWKTSVPRVADVSIDYQTKDVIIKFEESKDVGSQTPTTIATT